MAIVWFSAVLIAFNFTASDIKYSHVSDMHIYRTLDCQECVDDTITTFHFLQSDAFTCNSMRRWSYSAVFDGRNISILPGNDGDSDLKFCIGEVLGTGNIVFAFGVDFKEISTIISCKVKQAIHYPLVLDRYLLSDFDIGIGERNVLQKSGWPAICASFESAIDSTNDLIKFTTIDTDIFGMQSAAYWLDFCRMESAIITIQQRRITPAILTSDTSPCVIKQVNGLPNHTAQGNKDTLPMLCLEDFFSAVWRESAPKTNFVYLSSSSVRWDSSQTHSPPFGEAVLYGQLAAVLAAFENFHSLEGGGAGGGPLVVRSLLGEGWGTGGRGDTLNTAATVQQIRDSIYDLAYATDNTAWARAVSRIVYSWLDWFGGEPALPRHALVAALDSFGLRVGSEMCINRTAPPSASPYPWQYLCLSSSAREELREFLQLVPCGGTDHTPGEAICKHTQQLAQTIPALGTARPLAKKRSALRSPGYLLEPLEISRTSLGVLMFVALEDVLDAVEIVQGWQEGCPHCGLATQFVIFPVDVDRSGLPAEGIVQKDSQEFWLPGMRLVLLLVRQWIEHMSVSNDVVGVLLGLEAMRAFRHPGRKYGSGLIPTVTLGTQSHVHLPHPIVFALSEGEGEPAGRGRADIDIRAFAGMSGDVRVMSSDVLTSSEAIFSRVGAAHALREYAYQHGDVVAVDISKQLFDFDMSTRDPVAASVLSPFFPKSAVPQWPAAQLQKVCV